jgi:hypothetical protein
MNGDKHGYGIYRWADGRVYYGEWKKNKSEGHGYMRWPNGDYFCGEWKNKMKWGEGVSQKNGQLHRDKFEEGKLISRSKLPKVVEQK